MNRCRIESRSRYEIGVRIKTARIKSGLSQIELAEVCMVHKTTIYNWEQGSRLPDYRGLILLCRKLRVKSDWILGV